MVSGISLPALATAATPPANASGQALEIAPPVVSLKANPGQTLTAQIYLRDISSTSLVVTGQANDFVAAGEDGTPKILLNDDTANPYSMKAWVGTLPSLQLVPHEIKSMSVKINVPANAAPGGHYGVIRFTATPPNMNGTGVSLSASLGALLLITVNGNISENLSVQSFTASQDGKTKSLFESAPVTFSQVFKNSGNIHEEPNGTILISDLLGKPVASVRVNGELHNVLPASSRKFDEPLDSSVIGNKVLFGRYTASLHVTYGVSKKLLTATLVFWVIPYRLIGAAAVLLVVGFFILRFLIKRYNSHIIAQSQRSHRR